MRRCARSWPRWPTSPWAAVQPSWRGRSSSTRRNGAPWCATPTSRPNDRRLASEVETVQAANSLIEAPASTVPFSVRPLGPEIGGEVVGLDVSAGLDEAAFLAVRDALHRYS